MKHTFPIFFSLLLTLNLKAQTKRMTLVIDTIFFHDTIFQIKTVPKSLANTLIWPKENPVDFAFLRPSSFQKDSYPNYISQSFIVMDSTILIIPIDSTGNKLHIEKLFSCQCDTIRISRLNYFANDLNDTVSYSYSRYKIIGDSLIPLKQKTKHKIIYSRNSAKQNDKYSIIINNRTMTVHPKIAKSCCDGTNFSTACGEYQKWWQKYKRHFGYSEETTDWNYFAIVTF